MAKPPEENQPTRRIGEPAPTAGAARGVDIGVKKTEMAPPPTDRGEGKTRIAGLPQEFAASDKGKAAKASDDPVVGWVVVVDGPGKGNALPLGYGMNEIGRGSE